MEHALGFKLGEDRLAVVGSGVVDHHDGKAVCGRSAEHGIEVDRLL